MPTARLSSSFMSDPPLFLCPLLSPPRQLRPQSRWPVADCRANHDFSFRRLPCEVDCLRLDVGSDEATCLFAHVGSTGRADKRVALELDAPRPLGVRAAAQDLPAARTRFCAAPLEDRQAATGPQNSILEKLIGSIMEAMPRKPTSFPPACPTGTRPCSRSAITTSATTFSGKPKNQPPRRPLDERMFRPQNGKTSHRSISREPAAGPGRRIVVVAAALERSWTSGLGSMRSDRSWLLGMNDLKLYNSGTRHADRL